MTPTNEIGDIKWIHIIERDKCIAELKAELDRLLEENVRLLEDNGRLKSNLQTEREWAANLICKLKDVNSRMTDLLRG